MIIVTSATIIALAWVVHSINRDIRDTRRDLIDARADLHRFQQYLRHGVILPDHKGHFRIMVPIRATDGFADGEIRFAPPGELPEHMSFAWTDDNGSKHRATYKLTGKIIAGAIEARPIPV